MRLQTVVNVVLTCGLALLCAVGVGADALDDVEAHRAGVLYRLHCASCHGPEARGDGPVAEVLRDPPTDLTTIAERRHGVFPGTEIAEIIDGRRPVAVHGSREMPVWGLSFRDWGRAEDQEETIAERIDLLVRLLESWQRPTPGQPER